MMEEIDRDQAPLMVTLPIDFASEVRLPTVNVLTRSRHAPSLPGFAAALTAFVIALAMLSCTVHLESLLSTGHHSRSATNLREGQAAGTTAQSSSGGVLSCLLPNPVAFVISPGVRGQHMHSAVPAPPSGPPVFLRGPPNAAASA